MKNNEDYNDVVKESKIIEETIKKEQLESVGCSFFEKKVGTRKSLSFYEKLNKIQVALKCSKGKKNKFQGYSYRSCGDILEAVKPYLKDFNLIVCLSDKIITIYDRVYIETTACLFDVESEKRIEVKALAREQLEKKGMDESQVTGAASSYARKYALNGLFAIDDSEDSDSMDNRKEGHKSVL